MNLLLFLAVAPGLFLMYKIYQLDKIEKEPMGLLIKLVLLGAFLATMLAYFIETAGLYIAYSTFGFLPDILLAVIVNFVVVACSEEGMKYQILKRCTWENPAFDYRFDAIVYSVAVSVGFAIAENVKYVTSYGLATALVRAVTAIPGHTIFAIFMGMYYGQAKLMYNHEHFSSSSKLCRKAFLVPVFIHGLYDFLATMGGAASLGFIVFIIPLEFYAIKKVKREAREDRHIL